MRYISVIEFAKKWNVSERTVRNYCAKGKIKVDLSSTASLEEAYVLTERQNQFSQGILNPDGSTNRDSGENFSWGPKFDGFVRPWTSPVDTDGDGDLEWLSRPDSPVEDQLENFFRSGYTFNNSLSLSGGDDKFTYFVNILDYKLKDSSPPFEFLKPQIREILLSKRINKKREEIELKLVNNTKKKHDIKINL